MFERLVETGEQLRDAATALMQLDPQGASWRIIVKPFKETRRSKQNRYYWGVLIKTYRDWLLETTGVGYVPDHLHGFLKEKFGEYEWVVYPDGTEKITYLSTTKYNVGEFARFCALIEVYLVDELGVQLPADPYYQSIYDAIYGRHAPQFASMPPAATADGASASTAH